MKQWLFDVCSREPSQVATLEKENSKPGWIIGKSVLAQRAQVERSLRCCVASRLLTNYLIALKP
jgi:hypothetical protein